MSPFTRHLDLIRYLMVWRVNRSLVQLPRCLSLELSRGLGALIARRLPTREAHQWQQVEAAWESAAESASRGRRSRGASPELAWPIETVLFPYPRKRVYGPGEVVLWELKLLADSADHGLFLEWVLPAMEEASTTADPRWHQPRSLWGRFDIQGVYAARGLRWEPVVEDGRLDLQCRVTSTQWREGLTFGQDAERDLGRITWITPFDLGKMPDAPDALRGSDSGSRAPASETPTLRGMVESLISRMTRFMPVKRRDPEEVWELLEPQEREELQQTLNQPPETAARRAALEPAPRGWPGRWIGTHSFQSIPQPVLPYLELASLLHIGKQTHFGCGTFRLD